MNNLEDMKRRAIAAIREAAAEQVEREIRLSGGLLPDADRVYARRRRERETMKNEQVA